MPEIEREKYPLNPTMKFVYTDGEDGKSPGRLTAEGFRFMKAVAVLINNIEIVDGEIVTEMVAANAITDITIAQQLGSNPPDGTPIVSFVLPVSNAINTGVILTFTAVQGLPVVGGANFGSWRIRLLRNGVEIDGTGNIFYDDNFANIVAVQFVDVTPGTDPEYSVVATTETGPGDFTVFSGVLNGALFKR